MIHLRPSASRGRFDHGWLDTRHTFSFGDYYDPDHMGFGPLRVINEDIVAGGQGFGMHPHRDMEILTVVLSGALEHRDSLGSHGVIRPEDVQHMTAGRGVRHSEFNPSADTPVHLLQIWIKPREPGLTPGYSQKTFDPAARRNRLQILASPDGRESSLIIQQEATMMRAGLSGGASVSLALAPDRLAWVQVISGSARVNDAALNAGDGAGVEDESNLTITSGVGADVLVFDLPR
ncbi:MAG: pirin family protein [Phycisphaerae bacterium]|nr:pirin family protein [Phycisphaerae bacterium]